MLMTRYIILPERVTRIWLDTGSQLLVETMPSLFGFVWRAELAPLIWPVEFETGEEQAQRHAAHDCAELREELERGPWPR